MGEGFAEKFVQPAVGLQRPNSSTNPVLTEVVSAVTLAPNPTVIASNKAPSDMLDALLGVFSAKGFEGASVAELAQACGRSKASLYHHFPSGKTQMIEVLLKRCISDLDQRAFAGLPTQAQKGKAAAQALDSFIDGFGDYLSAHEGHCLLATLALTQPGLLTPLAQQHLSNWQARLSATFEHVGYKPKPAQRAAHALLARLYGSLTLTAMGSTISMQQACKLLKKDLQQHRKKVLRRTTH